MDKLTEELVSVLKELRKHPEGLSFEKLNITTDDYFYLRDNDYIIDNDTPIDGPCGRFCKHDSPIRIYTKGKSYLEEIEKNEANIKKNNKKYWITTAIAGAALARTLIPDIIAVAEQVLNILKQ